MQLSDSPRLLINTSKKTQFTVTILDENVLTVRLANELHSVLSGDSVGPYNSSDKTLPALSTQSQ